MWYIIVAVIFFIAGAYAMYWYLRKEQAALQAEATKVASNIINKL